MTMTYAKKNHSRNQKAQNENLKIAAPLATQVLAQACFPKPTEKPWGLSRVVPGTPTKEVAHAKHGFRVSDLRFRV